MGLLHGTEQGQIPRSGALSWGQGVTTCQWPLYSNVDTHAGCRHRVHVAKSVPGVASGVLETNLSSEDSGGSREETGAEEPASRCHLLRSRR